MGGIFRNPAFYLLALGSMCSIGAVGGTNQHLKLFLSLDMQFSQTAAASIASTVLACSIAGRLLMGWLADRIPRKHVMILIYTLIAGSIPLLFFADSPAALYAFAVIFGLGLGGEYMIIPLMAAELFGVRVLGRLMGVILTADGVAEATFPMLVGYLRDTTGSYRTGFVVLIALALAGTVAIAFLPRRGAHATGAVACLISERREFLATLGALSCLLPPEGGSYGRRTSGSRRQDDQASATRRSPGAATTSRPSRKSPRPASRGSSCARARSTNGARVPAELKELLAKHGLTFAVLSSGNLKYQPADRGAQMDLHLSHAEFVRDAGGHDAPGHRREAEGSAGDRRTTTRRSPTC